MVSSLTHRPGGHHAPMPRIALLFLLLLTPFAAITPLAAQRDGAPADLAAMVLRPSDLAVEGKDDFGIYLNILAFDPGTLADWADANFWDSANPDAGSILAADPERGYIGQLARTYVDGNLIVPTQSVVSLVLEYDDTRGARDGFDALSEVWLSDGALDEKTTRERIGSERLLLSGLAHDPDTGDDYERMSLFFRVDNLIGGVTILDYAGDDAPSRRLMESLAGALAERMDDVRTNGGPGLSTMMVRLDVVENTAYDRYNIIDGEMLCPSDMLDTCAESQETADEVGNTQRYVVNQAIDGDFRTGEPESYWFLGINVFEEERVAEERFASLRDRYGEPDDVEITSLPELGDEALAFRHPHRAFEGQEVYAVWFRDGTTIVNINHITETALAEEQGWTLEPQIEATNELAALQAACVAGETACVDPVPVPQAFHHDPDADPAGTDEATDGTTKRPSHWPTGNGSR